MAWPEHAMAVFQLLDKSNCRKCGEKTCLAFAGAVFQGRRVLAECPALAPKTLREYGGRTSGPMPDEDAPLDDLKQCAAQLDFNEAVSRIGGSCRENRLTVKILGKDFSIDHDGRLYSDIHMLPWVIGPFLGYLCDCRGRELTGEWVSLRELPGGAERYPLFNRRIEQAMQQVADRYTELFRDMAELFQGQRIASPFDADISVVLPVLPLVPILICYWRPDEGMDSSLFIFFDRSAGENIGVDRAYTLAAGLATMFEKLAVRHGIEPRSSG